MSLGQSYSTTTPISQHFLETFDIASSASTNTIALAIKLSLICVTTRTRSQISFCFELSLGKFKHPAMIFSHYSESFTKRLFNYWNSLSLFGFSNLTQILSTKFHSRLSRRRISFDSCSLLGAVINYCYIINELLNNEKLIELSEHKGKSMRSLSATRSPN